MSHSYGAIKFEDNSIYHIEFNGTVDICLPNLYKTIEEVEENWRKQEWKCCNCKPISLEPCEVAVIYGGGWYWNGFACRKCMVITNNFEPYPLENNGENTKDGLPDWYPDRELFLLK